MVLISLVHKQCDVIRTLVLSNVAFFGFLYATNKNKFEQKYVLKV